jgi:hypothetical protein
MEELKQLKYLIDKLNLTEEDLVNVFQNNDIAGTEKTNTKKVKTKPDRLHLNFFIDESKKEKLLNLETEIKKNVIC